MHNLLITTKGPLRGPLRIFYVMTARLLNENRSRKAVTNILAQLRLVCNAKHRTIAVSADVLAQIGNKGKDGGV